MEPQITQESFLDRHITGFVCLFLLLISSSCFTLIAIPPKLLHIESTDATIFMSGVLRGGAIIILVVFILAAANYKGKRKEIITGVMYAFFITIVTAVLSLIPALIALNKTG